MLHVIAYVFDDPISGHVKIASRFAPFGCCGIGCQDPEAWELFETLSSSHP